MFSFAFDPLQTGTVTHPSRTQSLTGPPSTLASHPATTSTQPTADPSDYGFYRNYPPPSNQSEDDGSKYFGLLFANSATGAVMDVPPPSVTPPPRPVSAPSAMFGAHVHLRGRERDPHVHVHLGSPLAAADTAAAAAAAAASFEETAQKDANNSVDTDPTTHQINNKKKVRTSAAQSRAKRSISTGSESAPKRATNTAPALLLSTTKPAATQRVLTHKKSDQRRREALRLSFARLQAVVPQQSPSASPASTGLPASGVPASSASPPSLLNDNIDNSNNNDDDDDDGGKGLNRVETMQATVRYIHALQEKNTAMDTKIAALQAELQRLKERQMHSY